MNSDNLYLDCNIILDWIIDRPPFSLDAVELINLIEKEELFGFVSPLVLANCYYIIKKTLDRQTAAEFVQDCNSIFNIIDNTKSYFQAAIEGSHKDFEDGLHYWTAVNNDLDYIITRNKDHFRAEDIKIRTAEEYLDIEYYRNN